MPSAPGSSPIPLDLQSTHYSYIERPNRVILSLLEEHVLSARPDALILDVGCGCGANAREVHKLAPRARVTGIEPNDSAAELARDACAEVFHGTLDGWLRTSGKPSFDSVVLSDVLEHIDDPVRFLRTLREAPELAHATWIISVPNFGVWYNRVRTLFGRFQYTWSGLYDRTHLRFFTRRSIRELLDYAGLEVVDDRCTPSVVQFAAPVIRRFFQEDVATGNHLALTENRAYQLYEKLVEPLETRVCSLWPELLGFQVVSVARAKQ
jgi:SAM-dependent methyltransferase